MTFISFYYAISDSIWLRDMSGEISIIKVGELDIKKIESSGNDYLCISDFVPKEGNVSSGITIINWLSRIGTINFLGL